MAVVVNSFLLFLTKSSIPGSRTPGMMVLTLLEMLLNIFLALSYSLPMITVLPIRVLYMARTYTIVVVNTVIPFVHGVRNYWMLLLAIMRAVIVVDPLVQQRRNLRLLSICQQGVLLVMFILLQSILLIPLFLDVTNFLKLYIRTCKLVVEVIIPCGGMLVSAVVVIVKFNQHNQHLQTARHSVSPARC